MTELPVSFTEQMKTLLGESYEDYLNSFEKPRWYGLRCNTTKVTPQEWEQISPFSLRPVPWTENGYYYPGHEKPSRDVYYYAGLYYLQEPSAMLPASLLPVAKGDIVLDICAAPGGKSTELGAKLGGTGLLVANDISNSRAKALLKNLEMFGLQNICVTSEEPAKLARTCGAVFDKILVDAPCSGEGMFRKDADMVKSFLERGPEYYVPIQQEIMEQAVSMLRPGGYLLYSTCTFDVRENEGVIHHILERFSDMELVKLPRFDGAEDGVGLEGCIRMFPHKLDGEGHFAALLRKSGSGGEHAKNETVKTPWKAKQDDSWKKTDLLQFLKNCHKKFDEKRLTLRQDMIYYLPEDFQDNWRLRYLRTGLLMGTVKNGRFEPSQALAMTFLAGDYGKTVTFSRSDERVIRYLKGETIAMDDGITAAKDWYLVCVDGYPLGWAKPAGAVWKNKYYPGWRWQ